MYTWDLITITQVRDIMEKNVITIDKDKTALDVAALLKEKEIRFLVVVNKSKPSGIVSERDIVRKIAAKDLTASSIKLEEVMSNKFRWVEPDTKIEFAVQKMINNNIRRLLVLENEDLVGVITQTNLTEFLQVKF